MPLKRLSRRAAFWIVVLLQGLAIIAFAGWREVELRTGTEVVLATVPVDPRDLFRGDYVVLRYEISTISNTYGCGVPGSSIYVELRQSGDVWRAVGYSDDLEDAQRSGATVIAGRITDRSRSTCTVAYGIENYFVPEGTGRDIERARGRVKVHVVVSGDGTATIKGLELP